jgi:hypothetical protein
LIEKLDLVYLFNDLEKLLVKVDVMGEEIIAHNPEIKNKLGKDYK